MTVLETVAAVGMAVGPPLAYSDQFVSILRKRSSAGFSLDVCGVLIVANVTRVVYWMGERFQLALLVQSFLMIFAQFALLYVCLLYRPQLGDGIVDPGTLQDQDTSSSLLPGPSASSSARIPRLSRRPFDLWQWASFGMYVEFTALLVVIHCGMFFVLYGIIRSKTYVGILGFLALGLEATLPIPQLLVNFQRKSTAGFRHSVLASWVGGDAIKTIYFFATDNNSLAFKACAIFQLSVDILLCFQTYSYREQTARDLASGRGAILKDDQGVAGAETLWRAAHLNRDSSERRYDEPEVSKGDEEDGRGRNSIDSVRQSSR